MELLFLLVFLAAVALLGPRYGADSRDVARRDDLRRDQAWWPR